MILSAALVLTACDWNRSAKAQRRQYASGGTDVPAASKNALTRGLDYHKLSADTLIRSMRRP